MKSTASNSARSERRSNGSGVGISGDRGRLEGNYNSVFLHLTRTVNKSCLNVFITQLFRQYRKAFSMQRCPSKSAQIHFGGSKKSRLVPAGVKFTQEKNNLLANTSAIQQCRAYFLGGIHAQSLC